jgi:hypothetical protein
MSKGDAGLESEARRAREMDTRDGRAEDGGSEFPRLLARIERERARGAERPRASRERHWTPAAGDRHAAMLSEPLTPELVLVDPELARRAREELAEPAYETAPVEPQARRSNAKVPEAATAGVGHAWPEDQLHEVPVDVRPRTARRKRIVALGLLVAAATGTFAAIRLTESRLDSGRTPARTEAPSISTVGPSGRSSLPAPKNMRAAGKTPRAAGTHATPGSRKPPQSAVGGARRFAWPPVAKGSFYLVQLYRGGKEIFEARPSEPGLLLPEQWIFGGRRYRLLPGSYRWSVRPGFGRPSAARYGNAIVQARLVVQKPAAR